MAVGTRGVTSRHIVWGILLCVVLFAGYLIIQYMPRKMSDSAATVSQTAAAKKHADPVSLSSRVAFFGNTFWGRYTNDWAMANPLKTAYPFSRLGEFHRDQYEAWITGLECPTKSDVHMTSAEMEAALQFNCDPAYLPEAAKWFTAFTLANNHTDNQGEDGFAQTQQALEKNHIQYFGHYDPRESDELCDVIALPVVVTQNDNSTLKAQLPVAFCGYHGVFRIPPDEGIARMQRYAKVMPVFAMPHMGAEYKPAPDEIKTTVYHKFIDNGADAVLGDHPHWVQNTEAYKGHLIVYSMGNFMFDQQDSMEVTRSAGISLTLGLEKADPEQLRQWIELGKTCGSFHDDCLEEAEQKSLAKLPLTYRFGVIGTNDGGKITHPATAAETEAILKRLNWQATMTKLAAPYGSL